VAALPFQLAYEASVRAIEDQARVLEELRSRAATLVAAAALVTGFLGQEALTRADEVEPLSWVGLALGSFIATATATLVILWPLHLRFSLSAADMIEILDERESAKAPVSDAEALREVAMRLEVMYDENAPRIGSLLWIFRSAIVLLSIEVAAWVVALWRL
jgi:hypothetical protein